jgi:RHS repeat-associated protein
MKAGRVFAGHPVDVASGVQFTAAHDVEVPGEFPLIFRRLYSTALLDRPSITLGRAWCHTLEATLRRDLDGFQFSGHGGEEVFFDDPDATFDTAGRLLAAGDGMELRREDDRWVVLHWHDLDSGVERYVFAGDGDRRSLTALESPGGAGLTLTYDRYERLRTVVERPERRGLRLDYDQRGRLERLLFTAPALTTPAVVATYEYDQADRLIVVKGAGGVVTRYGYDDAHRLVSEEGPAGLYTMAYDDQGRCVETTGQGGQGRRRFVYEPGRTTRVIDSLDRETVYQANERGQIELEVLPGGGKVTRTFDEHGRLTSLTGPYGATSRYGYDERGDQTVTVFPTGATRTVAFDDEHLPVAIHDASGGTWRLAYQHGALVGVVDPLGARTEYQRDAHNALVAIVHPGGNRVEVETDPDWYWQSFRDSLGFRVRRRFDHQLNLVELDDGQGGVERLRHDERGLLVAATRPDGTTRQWSYDRAGLLVAERDGRGITRHWERSEHGDCRRIVDGLGHATELVRDGEGRLIEVRKPLGESAHFVYDHVDRLVERRGFGGEVERTRFFTEGRGFEVQKADGTRVRVEQDSLGNLLRVSAGGVTLIANRYNEVGQLVESTTPASTLFLEYDLLGRVTAEIQNDRRIELDRDAAGNLVKVTVDGRASGPLVIAHDRRGRVVSLADDGGVFQELTHDDRDRLVQRRMGAVSERLTHDAVGRVIGQELGEILGRIFTYDPDGDVTAVQDSARGPRRFAYDAVRQVIRSSSEEGESQYAYDADGNVRYRNRTILEYAPGDRLLGPGGEGFRYDDCGRAVEKGSARYRWNALDQLVGARGDGGEVTFGYDGLGRRVWKESGGVRTDYLWAGDDLLAERSPGRAVEYAVAGFEPWALWVDGELRHAVTTPLGPVTELLDREGRQVWQGRPDEWGRLDDGDAPALRLPGQLHDPETGLHYNRFRYYDPEYGRFISPDPVGLLGGLNAYRYAPSALGWSDPLGLACGATTSGYSVYVLEKASPPPPPQTHQVVYVGITKQMPHERLSQHRNDRPPGQFDRMRVIQTHLTDNTALSAYRQARNMEGSALLHLTPALRPRLVAAGAPPLGNIENAPRGSGGYYHGYHSGDGAPRTVLPAATVATQMNNTEVTLPR